MGERDFYLTLPSNSSSAYYPDNTIDCYRTKLPQAIHLNTPYEVALTEIHYPLTWDRFPEEDAVIAERFEAAEGVKRRLIPIPTGYYKSIEQLVKVITQSIEKAAGKRGGSGSVDNVPSFGYDAITNRVKIVSPYNTELKFNGKLASILGFPSGKYLRCVDYEEFVAPLPADLNGGTYAMYVYTDLIEHHTVGDFNVQLMRVVHIEDTPTKHVTTLYAKPQYHQLAKNHFSTIEVSVKNDQNKPLGFTYGKIVLVFHFRPSRIN